MSSPAPFWWRHYFVMSVPHKSLYKQLLLHFKKEFFKSWYACLLSFAESLGHIILIPVFAIYPYCCILSGEATNTNFIVFDLTQLGLEPMIYRTRGKHANHYTMKQ
jgi:hypothetical protein